LFVTVIGAPKSQRVFFQYNNIIKKIQIQPIFSAFFVFLFTTFSNFGLFKKQELNVAQF